MLYFQNGLFFHFFTSRKFWIQPFEVGKSFFSYIGPTAALPPAVSSVSKDQLQEGIVPFLRIQDETERGPAGFWVGVGGFVQQN